MNEVYQQIRSVFNVSPGRPLPIDTGQRYGDRKRLADLCKRLGYKRGAELGVRGGSFSELFCKAGLEMWCVDPWAVCPNYPQERQDRSYAAAVKTLAPYNAHLVRKCSADATGDVPDGLDFLHIDGRHEFDYVMCDIIQWAPKVRAGGIIAIHDYHLSGVKRAIEAYTLAHHIDPWFYLKDHQPTAFWVAQ
jgi:hypothetical protein